MKVCVPERRPSSVACVLTHKPVLEALPVLLITGVMFSNFNVNS